MKTKKENIVKMTAMEMVDKAKRHPVFFAEYILGMKLSEFERDRLNKLVDAVSEAEDRFIYYPIQRVGMNTAKSIVRKWRNYKDDKTPTKFNGKDFPTIYVDECRFA